MELACNIRHESSPNGPQENYSTSLKMVLNGHIQLIPDCVDIEHHDLKYKDLDLYLLIIVHITPTCFYLKDAKSPTESEFNSRGIFLIASCDELRNC